MEYWLCDVRLRPEDTMNLGDRAMFVVGVFVLMVGLGAGVVHAEEA